MRITLLYQSVFNKNKAFALFLMLGFGAFTSTVKAQYCTTSYVSGTGSGDYISLVDFVGTTLNNPSVASSSPYYTFFPNSGSSTTTFSIGVPYTLNVAGGTFVTCYISMWGDWNQDGVFSTSEFMGTSPNVGSTVTASFSGNIVIPYSALAGNTRIRFRSSDTSPGPGPSDACNATNSDYGETEDYEITILPLPSCSGTPFAGNAMATPTLVCINTPFNLDLSGNTLESGITYQWQSSPNGSAWTNMGSIQNSWLVSINSLTATTYYQCITTCTAFAQSATSTPVVVNLNPLINCYCLPSYVLSCANGDNFSNFSIANVVSQLTNCDLNGFSDSTASAFTVVNLTAGNTYTLQANIGSTGNMIAGAWIDYNQNSIFDDSEFTYLGTGVTQTYSNTLTVPLTAASGSVRMRLKMEVIYSSTSATLDPCNNNNSSTYGQILDYKVNITAAPACTGTLSAGITIATSTAVCNNTPNMLNLDSNSVASEIIYQWQSSVDGGTSWTNIGLAQNTIPLSIQTQSVTTYYRCISTCTISAVSDTSTPVMVSQILPQMCNCIPPPSNCNFDGLISNVIFSTLNHSSACSINGYINYADSIASAPLIIGQSYSLTLTVGSAIYDFADAWIDYDQDGEFEKLEFTSIGQSQGGGNFTISNSILIPMNATFGNTKIRVRNNNGGQLDSLKACDGFAAQGKNSAVLLVIGHGETEDYLVTILPATETVTGITDICSGNSATLNLSPSLTSASNLTYQWKSFNGTNYVNDGIASISSNFTATPGVNTLYFCEIMNNGIIVLRSDTILVKVHTLTIAPVITNSVCNGACNGSIILNAVSSTSINYLWLPASILTTDVATGLCAGSYTAIVTDGQGSCSITNTFIITQPGAFSASIAGSSSVMCEQLVDTLKSNITGGIAPYSLSWTELPSTIISTNANYEYTTSVGNHSYNLVVTDANNCAAVSNTLNISVNPSSNFSGMVTTNTTVPVAGRVILYKYLPFYTKFDSVAGQNIAANGSFLFNSFTSGTYIIKAVPTATNLQIAYGDSAVNWKTAKLINHGCAVNDIQNIEVKSLAVLTNTTGISGTLRGGIYGGPSYGQRMGNFGDKLAIPGNPIGGIIVKGGKNPGGQMFVQTITDPTTGTYTLSGLPANSGNESYFILVDIPGLDTNNTYHRIINASNNDFQGLDFLVDSAKINPILSSVISVHDISAIENKIKMFPNPASNQVTIQYSLKDDANVKIELFDIVGKSVKTILPLTQQNNREYSNTILLNDLTSGIYFIKVYINNSESTIKLFISK